jgi:hypothetical protein
MLLEQSQKSWKFFTVPAARTGVTEITSALPQRLHLLKIGVITIALRGRQDGLARAYKLEPEGIASKRTGSALPLGPLPH